MQLDALAAVTRLHAWALRMLQVEPVISRALLCVAVSVVTRHSIEYEDTTSGEDRVPTVNGDRSPRRVIDELAALTEELANLTYPSDERTRNDLRKRLEAHVTLLNETAGRLDSVLKPSSLFDPGDPQTSARVIALATVAQPRHQLAGLRPFYGAGVYALYYRGPFEPYEGLAGKEQPIYVGKADPLNRHAVDPEGQGQALYKRLLKHAKNIGLASTTLDPGDFDCRFLIVQSGFQQAAETRLINFFKPIWNSESKVCQGLGKHGDSPETRANKRSPWDTLHPGRPWAEGSLENQKKHEQIIDEIREHLKSNPPKSSVAEILDAFVNDLRQINPSEFFGGSNELQEVHDLANEGNMHDYPDSENKLF